MSSKFRFLVLNCYYFHKTKTFLKCNLSNVVFVFKSIAGYSTVVWTSESAHPKCILCVINMELSVHMFSRLFLISAVKLKIYT